MQEELVKIRRQLLQRQSTSFQDFSLTDSAVWAEEKQQLQQDSNRLRRERDSARAQQAEHRRHSSSNAAQRSSGQQCTASVMTDAHHHGHFASSLSTAACALPLAPSRLPASLSSLPFACLVLILQLLHNFWPVSMCLQSCG